MTQKELSYIEDAIKHEENLSLILDESLNFVEDEKLQNFLSKQRDNHESLKEKLLNLLRENCHE